MAERKAPDAQRVIDTARASVADDPDLLYYVAHLYQRIDQPKTTELVLQDVIKLDPQHPQAGNDLGYTWADEGRNLDRAESLIRNAVRAEPDNPSYLDSLAWVLYKRSKFAEAYPLLKQAAQPEESADPVVLDHLGDVLYRLSRAAEASTTWKKCLDRIDEATTRRDLIELRTALQTKLRQAEAGEPVTVAPVVEPAASKEQARN
jgi:cytochrome c-type biogenesis protein CcmH/NrfG